MKLINRPNNQKRSRRQNRQNGNRSRGGGKRESGTSTRILERTRLSNQRDVVQRFVRTTTQVVALNPQTGFQFAAPAFDMGINFSLTDTNFFAGGTLQSAASNVGYSDFTALYDSYKIEKVEIAIMYSTNAYAPTTTSGALLPILNIVFDPNDVSVISLSSILQYRNLRTIQLGNLRNSAGYVMEITPVPVISAIGGTDAVTLRQQWLNIDQPDIPHYGVKIFYDDAASSLATNIGTISFYVKYHLAFKLAH